MKQYGDTIVTQSVYFAYDFLDLAHAAGQPAAAGRAFDAQMSRYAKRHPGYARIWGADHGRRAR